MNFTYEIKGYNKDLSQVLVLYTPENETPKHKLVNIDPTWSEQQIKDGITAQFPILWWTARENASAQLLVNTQGSATYVAPAIQEHVATQNEISDQVRSRRRGLLMDSDWTQLSDTPLTNEQKLAWATYRQELRDITVQIGFPNNIVWPNKPE